MNSLPRDTEGTGLAIGTETIIEGHGYADGIGGAIRR